MYVNMKNSLDILLNSVIMVVVDNSTILLAVDNSINTNMKGVCTNIESK